VLADREDGPDIRAGTGTGPAPALAPARVPGQLVIDEPRGGGDPRGLIWILCCGGWGSPADLGVDLRVRADRDGLGAAEWRRQGYVVATYGYRGGRRSFGDALAAFDSLRARFPDLPVCAIGASAGGHVALLTAAERPELRCVVAQGAPSELGTLPSRSTGIYTPEPPRRVARRLFGASRFDELSPVTHAGAIEASVWMSACSDDRVVPPGQATRFGDAMQPRLAPGQAVETPIVEGRTPRRGGRPRRGTVELIHGCFVTKRRRARHVRDTIRFVRRTLAGQRSDSRASGS
jgi:fermentation-respiration switch protein FrsA (DUF1100 family)